jgi:hypothetical protein
MDNKCAPHLKYTNGSCFTLNTLIKMAKAYNYSNADKIKLNDREELMHPNSYKNYLENQVNNKLNLPDNANYKQYLVDEVGKRLSNKCTTQLCWLNQSFMKNINRNELKEIRKHTFRPDGPSGTFEWLNTTHINDVMHQYELKYDDFLYLGALPMDFDDLYKTAPTDMINKPYNILKLDFNKLIKMGKTKLGMILNLDEHWQSGSHWVALYFDLKQRQIYYFDSYGIRPEVRVRRLMNRVEDFLKTTCDKPIEYSYNKKRHQYKNSECGVYSINFILRLLKGYKFKQISKNRISDEKINKCRKRYFNS